MVKTWFDVTVTETYHHTYKVAAESEREAEDLVNALVDDGNVDPTQDGGHSCSRDVSAKGSEPPSTGDEYWELGKKNGAEPKRYQAPVCGAPLYIACGYMLHVEARNRAECLIPDKCPWKKEET